MTIVNRQNFYKMRMRRRKYLYCVAAFTSLFLSACSNEEEVKHEFFNEKILCPSPAIDEYQPWGKSGLQHICKIKHGQFIAWEEGYVHIRGQYDYGKEVGLWLWYDSSGNVTKKIDYSKTGINGVTH